MGDRCYLEITFRKEDREKVIEHLDQFDEEDDKNNNTITAIIYESNYSQHDDRQKLAQDKIAFYGGHGSGGNYPEGVFAAYNGEHIDTQAIDGFPGVRVREEGVDQGDVELAKKYYKVVKKVQTYFSMKPGIYAAKMVEP